MESLLRQPTADADARVAASIDHWKRKLLDLSKRNRLLNFKVNKVSTVHIVDEQPAEVFRSLFLMERSMRFAPAPEAERSRASGPGGPEEGGEDDPMAEAEEPAELLAPEFAPYEASDLAHRHKDDVLQTASPPEALDRSLRRLDDQARTTIEEQGVNTLFLALGMLSYRESEDSREFYRAPLVLLPVALGRKSAKTGYTVRVADEDPFVNPALAEYLRRTHAVSLPDLPEWTDIPTDYDLQSFLLQVMEATGTKAGWTVTTDIYLAPFAFQKFVMFKDLEANGSAFGGHPLVRQLITRSGTTLRGLPDEIRSMDLDRQYPPESTYQVVNADSSQLRAIAAVASGHDMVIEGPPGTGKSQTITNLIARALSQGKSVLFVAEKMAALDVVHTRLVEAGFGEFCLELHSGKANKRLVMKGIAEALDASLQRPRLHDSSGGRLQELRQDLRAYAEALHTPFGALNASPFRIYGELGMVLAAPKVPYTGPVEDVERERLEATVRDFEDLAEASTAIGVPAEHPWRDTGRTFYPESGLDEVEELLRTLGGELREVIDLAGEVEASLGLPRVRTFADVRTAIEVAEVLGRSPGAPLAVLQSEAWNAPPSDALDLVRRGRELARLREHVGERFKAEVLEQEHASEIAFIEEKESSFFRWLNFLNGRFRLVRRRWMGYRQAGYSASLLEQAEEMKKVDVLRRERSELQDRHATGTQLFGGLWRGEESSWDALQNYIGWVVEFRAVCVSHELEGRALETAARPAPDLSRVARMSATTERALSTLRTLASRVEWPERYLEDRPLQEVRARAEAMRENIELAPRWAAFELARSKVATGIGKGMLPPAMRGEIAFGDLPRAFRRAFFQQWLATVVQERRPLLAFQTLTHEQRVAEFRRLDERVLDENRITLVAQLRDQVQARLRTPEAVAGMPFLRREMARQRALSPLRKTLRNAEAAIRAIKPCFLMSPLTVAQLIDGAEPSFDLVIFDEASQLPAEDAVGAIARGERLVVVGDPKQLPPTNFFSVMTGQVQAPLGADGQPLFEDTESILEEMMGAGVPTSRLKWHYRSTHESLITFSNVSFYDADLFTFPSVETDSHGAGLQFEYIPEGVYEGKGLNLVEARRVADAVVEHAKLHPELSLGVGTFNLRQQIAIQDELEIRRRQDPSIEPFFARKEEGGFFVKNLENIQGDERDVIFISVTYAKDADGKLRYNFGPLNGENGWRRLNVLTTRARKRMKVFSSMRGDEINPASTSSNGPRLLREFLLYAEHGRLESVVVSDSAETESPFEREVYQALTHRGLRLQPQVGVAGYRIDLGVLDEAVPGRFVCGIECDGVAYHASETARDRDRLRQQVLEARGWTIFRIWSTDWFKDRPGQIDRILRLVEEARRRAVEEREAEEEARARAAEEAALAAETIAQEPPVVEAVLADPTVGSSTDPDSPLPELVAEPYVMADASPVHQDDLLAAPASAIARVISEVVEVEGPIHMAELASRVASRWGVSRVGSRILARITYECGVAARRGLVEIRGDFVWGPVGRLVVRSRAGTKLSAERIAPEEYREALLMVLRVRDMVPRAQLVAEVRSLLGYSRTGAKLEESIGSALDALLADGTVGEASTGMCIRG